MKTKRIGWAIAVRLRRGFMPIPSSTRSTRTEAIQGYYGYEEHKIYEQRRRSGTAKIVPLYANEEDLL